MYRDIIGAELRAALFAGGVVAQSDLHDLSAQNCAAVGLHGGNEALCKRAELLVLPAVVNLSLIHISEPTRH